MRDGGIQFEMDLPGFTCEVEVNNNQIIKIQYDIEGNIIKKVIMDANEVNNNKEEKE